jgi:polar amino acid transport system substrate-binding protein
MAWGAELAILTDEYPPISFGKDGVASGLGSEVVNEIQRRLGTHAVIQLLPWARAYAAALRDANTALFATVRTAERETLFKWVGPLATVSTSFYARRGSGLKITQLAQAKDMGPIIVPLEYYSHQFLRSEGFSKLEPVSSPEIMARMVLAGRRPLMVNDNLTLPALLAKSGAQPQDVELLYTFMESQLYIAFSNATSDATVQQWQAALDDMKRDGSFARLYQKWLPGTKPPGLRPAAPG